MSDQDSDVSDIETETVYVCKKCPGVTLKSEEAREEHREFHRSKRTNERQPPGPASKKRKPGPASRRGRNERGGSPVPSSATMFSVRAVTRSATEQAEDEDNSASARNKRAIRSHVQKSKVYNRKNDGG